MVTLIKFIDKYVGNAVCHALSLFSKKREIGKKSINRILAVQLWGIGETILTLPSFEALRKKFPKSEIHVLATTRNSKIYEKEVNIDKIITIKPNPFGVIGFIFSNSGKYDLAIDMEEYLNISAIISFFVAGFRVGYSHGARSKLYTKKVRYNDRQHVVQTYLDLVRGLGVSYNAAQLPKISSDKKTKESVEKFLKENDAKNFFCIAPGAAESAQCRMWPKESYAQLINRLIAKYRVKIILTGTLQENELNESIIELIKKKESVINSAGKIDLEQLFYLISKARLFIGNDSGPMHIAAAQGTKTIGLFGPNLPVRFGPYGKGNIGIYKGENCKFSPCINVHLGQVPDCLYAKNSSDYQKCMKNIDVEDVMGEVEKVF